MHSWTPLVVSLPSLMFSYNSEITVATFFFSVCVFLQGKPYLFIYKLTLFNNNNMTKTCSGKEQRVNFFFLAGPKWPLVATAFEMTGVCLAWKITAIGKVMLQWSILKRNSRILKIESPYFFFLTVASPAQVCWCNFQRTKKCLRSHLSQVSQIQDQWKNELFIWSGMRSFFPSFLVIKISFVWLKLNLSPGWVYLCTIYACFMNQQHTALVVCTYNYGFMIFEVS